MPAVVREQKRIGAVLVALSRQHRCQVRVQLDSPLPGRVRRGADAMMTLPLLRLHEGDRQSKPDQKPIQFPATLPEPEHGCDTLAWPCADAFNEAMSDRVAGKQM